MSLHNGEAYHGAMAETPRSVANAPNDTLVVNAPTDRPVVNAPRRKPGRGSQVMPDERREIQFVRLVEGLNQRQLAERFGRTRETIAGVLKDDGFQALKREIDTEMAEEARSTLNRHVRNAAKDWVKASAIAAQRGDHKPAKDLLMHAGVIERISETSGPQMTVVVGMPGHPAMIPPSQEVIDAEAARQEALRGQQATNRAARAIDVVAQPHAARLLAPEPDTPAD